MRNRIDAVDKEATLKCLHGKQQVKFVLSVRKTTKELKIPSTKLKKLTINGPPSVTGKKIRRQMDKQNAEF
jgi:hypothetical protein